MYTEYRWVRTKQVRRWKTIFGNRRSETTTLRPATRGANRRTIQKGQYTFTEEWLPVAIEPKASKVKRNRRQTTDDVEAYYNKEMDKLTKQTLGD